MNLSDLQTLMDEDSEIDDKRLDFESLNIPQIQSKWFRLFMDELGLLKALQARYYELKRDKTEYYLGKCEDHVYKEKPLDKKILKTDVDLYLNADEDLVKVQFKMEMQKAKTDMVEQFIKGLSYRGNNIRTALDFKKFQAGEY